MKASELVTLYYATGKSSIRVKSWGTYFTEGVLGSAGLSCFRTIDRWKKLEVGKSIFLRFVKWSKRSLVAHLRAHKCVCSHADAS